ncbi:hypothetical protein SMICM17S_00935 [Streptomyces microflavus]
MYGENARPNTQEPPGLPEPPAPGTLVVDTSRADRVGEFRGWRARTGPCARWAAGASGRPSPATYALRC